MALTLEGKPWYVSLGVGLLIGGLAVFGAHRVWLSKMSAQITRQESRLQELQDQIARGRAAQAQVEAFRERVARLSVELEKLLRILPDRRNVDVLLRRIHALAEREDFVLSSVRPRSEIEREFYSEWPITLNIQGGYHNLARFFDRISRISRIINVDNLNINARRGEGPHTITAGFTAKTFVYKDQPPVEGEQQQ